MPYSSSNAGRNFVLSVLAVLILLTVFSLSFWMVIRGVEGGNYNNRAQSQVRSLNEEALANRNWDPNRLLAGYEQKLPASGSWGDRFGRPLVHSEGVDADNFLYPQGLAPAPGSWIAGDTDMVGRDAIAAFLDGEDVFEEPNNQYDRILPTEIPSAGRLDAMSDPSHERPAKRSLPRENQSPVSDLLN